jgi:hypothetical protein
VREEDVDIAQRFAGLDFVVHKMAPFVGDFGGARGALLRMRQLSRWRFVPRRRKRAAKSRDADGANLELHRIWDEVHILR